MLMKQKKTSSMYFAHLLHSDVCMETGPFDQMEPSELIGTLHVSGLCACLHCTAQSRVEHTRYMPSLALRTALLRTKYSDCICTCS